MSSSVEAGVWIAIATGALTALATIYGLFREWQNYRQNQASRLSNAAGIAVRRAEANVVRPLLRERMATTINRFLQNQGACDPLCFRTLLFRDLNTHQASFFQP